MTSPMINSFYYQGRTAAEIAEGLSPSWHVTLVSEVPDGFGGLAARHLGPITPDQAQAQFGLTLEDVLGVIATSALAEAAAMQAQRDSERDRRVAAEAERDTLSARVAELEDKLTSEGEQ